jgi:hypothetical protein
LTNIRDTAAETSTNGMATHSASDNTESEHAMLAAAARTTQTLAARHCVWFIGWWLEVGSKVFYRPHCLLPLMFAFLKDISRAAGMPDTGEIRSFALLPSKQGFTPSS